MTKRKFICLVSATTLAPLAYFAWKFTARGAYESAEYTVLESDGPFEIRQYQDLVMATTSMQSAPQGDDSSFMRLFHYISGNNNREQEVAMTTPVFMSRESGDDSDQMGFVMPQNIAEEKLPAPAHENVQIQKRMGGKFAVYRFNGRMDRESTADARQQLSQWMQSKQLLADGNTERAGYDPPWTPGLLRRNEVLVRLK